MGTSTPRGSQLTGRAPDDQETVHTVTDDSQRTLINVKSLLFILTSRERAEVKKNTKTTKGI